MVASEVPAFRSRLQGSEQGCWPKMDNSRDSHSSTESHQSRNERTSHRNAAQAAPAPAQQMRSQQQHRGPTEARLQSYHRKESEPALRPSPTPPTQCKEVLSEEAIKDSKLLTRQRSKQVFTKRGRGKRQGHAYGGFDRTRRRERERALSGMHEKEKMKTMNK